MILYPTETIYALGVNALQEAEIAKLFQLKGRAEGKGVSWLVRDCHDIMRFGKVSDTAANIAEQFLPGPLTLVVPANAHIPEALRGPDDTVSFRISPDPVAQEVISKFMAEHDAPLTCTSANVSGLPTMQTPTEILEQFGEKASQIDEVVDDGPRIGAPSTVVRVVNQQVDIIREGAISTPDIFSARRNHS